MLSYKKYCNQILDESLITFGNQKETRFNQVVIMAGGAGSGKGFIKDSLLGIEGKVFDPDALKSMALKKTNMSQLMQPILDKLYDSGKLSKKFSAKEIVSNPEALKDPDNVSALHLAVKELKWDTEVRNMVFKSISDPNRFPNLIFDATLQTPQRAHDLIDSCLKFGYKPENIHLVWVLNSFEVAAKQNAGRSRTVSYEIMVATHTGAAQTMKKFLETVESLPSGINGFIYLVFNNKDANDASWKKDHAPGNPFGHPTRVVPDIDKDTGKQKIDKNGKPVFKPEPMNNSMVWVRKLKLKDRGKPVNLSLITKEIDDRIKQYVPKGAW